MPTRRCPSTTTTTWLAIAVLATARSSAAAITGVGTLLSGSGSSAGRGLALGVLLASPHLAAARPLEAANTSVAATRRKLGYAMTTATSQRPSPPALEQRIRRGGVRPHLDVGTRGDSKLVVCSADEEFVEASRNVDPPTFNQDIGAWDTSGVTTVMDRACSTPPGLRLGHLREGLASGGPSMEGMFMAPRPSSGPGLVRGRRVNMDYAFEYTPVRRRRAASWQKRTLAIAMSRAQETS